MPDRVRRARSPSLGPGPDRVRRARSPSGRRPPIGPRPDTLPEIPVVYEDGAWLVIDKPSGWAVNASETSNLPSVAEWFSDRGVRVVHRLDRGTTGVMVLAKGAEAAAQLSRAFAERAVSKTYWALVEGPGVEGELTEPIGPDRKRPRARAVRPDGQAASTQVAILVSAQTHAWLEAKPRTGRTHQIRVHLADQGAPLLGDQLYGGPAAIDLGAGVCRVTRPMLHSRRLVLPTSTGPRAFEAPPPADFCRLAGPWLDVVRMGAP